MNKLFVYGTLRSDTIHLVIPGVVPYINKIATGYINAKLFDLGEYPGAVKVDDEVSKVYGEIIEINSGKLEFVLNSLDEYEEVNKDVSKSLFQRSKALVTIEGGEKIEAWIYWYNKEVKGFEEIKDGIFRKRKNTTAL